MHPHKSSTENPIQIDGDNEKSRGHMLHFLHISMFFNSFLRILNWFPVEIKV